MDRVLGAMFRYRHPMLETSVAGLRFPNPIGLAAGFDKDCCLAPILPALGFGFLELGTVTPRPQVGNPRPRMARILQAQALINRLGFNNSGTYAAAQRLASLKARPVPLGINLGINADVRPEEAPEEYAKAFSALYPYGDYFAVNVSSPNTPGLRRLQDKLRLEHILTALKEINPKRKPVFVKLSPDLDFEELKNLIPILEREASGVICTNTTVRREGLPESMDLMGGGISGEPLRELSTRRIREVFRLSQGRLPIIGVGGIFNAQDAYQKIRAGASLVQVYTGLIYRGPGLVSEINRTFVELLKAHGLKNISEAVGRSHEGGVLASPGKGE